MSDPVTPDATNDAPTSGEDDWLLDAPDDGTEGGDAVDKPSEGQPEGDKPADGQADADQPAPTDKDKLDDPENPEASKPDKDKLDADTKQNPDNADDLKRHNDDMAKQRIQARQVQQQAIRDAAGQFVQNARDQVDEAGEDETKRELAAIKAREAERDAREFVRDVETNQSVMQNDHSRIAREVPMFRELNEDGTPNPEYNQKAYDRALEHLAPYLETQEVPDAQGKPQLVVLGSKVSVYEFLKQEADTFSELLGSARTQGAVEGQKAEQQMRSATEPGQSSTPPAQSAEDKEVAQMAEAFAGI